MTMLESIKTAWKKIFRGATETLSEDYIGDKAPRSLRAGLIVSVTAFVFLIGLGIYWSGEPAEFDILQGPSSKQLVRLPLAR